MDREHVEAAAPATATAPFAAGPAGHPEGDNDRAGAPAAAAAEAVERERHGLTLHLMENAATHALMEGHYDWLHRIATGATILAGTSAVAAILAGFNATSGMAGGAIHWALIANFVIVAIGVADFVFDFGGQARAHRDQRRRFTLLYADLIGAPDDTLSKIRADLVRISADGPGAAPVVRAQAHNSVLRSLYSDAEFREYRIRIRWWQRLLGRFITSIRVDDERKAA